MKGLKDKIKQLSISSKKKMCKDRHKTKEILYQSGETILFAEIPGKNKTNNRCIDEE